MAYGLIGHIKAQPGKRDDLIQVLGGSGDSGMPGCLSYVVARDPEDPDGLWVTEVWADQASHRASLEMPAVREAISRGRPLIAEFDARHETEPVSGF